MSIITAISLPLSAGRLRFRVVFGGGSLQFSSLMYRQTYTEHYTTKTRQHNLPNNVLVLSFLYLSQTGFLLIFFQFLSCMFLFVYVRFLLLQLLRAGQVCMGGRDGTAPTQSVYDNAPTATKSGVGENHY